jgi:hypothetical protein
MYGQSKHGNQIECGAILTESGLLLDNGETITSGHILDRVKELDKLCNDKNWNGFLESYDDAIKTLSHKDYITLRDTLLPNFGDTVWCAQSDIYESLHPEQDIGKRKRTPIPPNFTGIPYEEYIKEHPEDFDNLE